MHPKIKDFLYIDMQIFCCCELSLAACRVNSSSSLSVLDVLDVLDTPTGSTIYCRTNTTSVSDSCHIGIPTDIFNCSIQYTSFREQYSGQFNAFSHHKYSRTVHNYYSVSASFGVQVFQLNTSISGAHCNSSVR